VADRRHPTVTGDVQRRRHAVPRATVGRGGRRDQPRIPLIFLLIAVAGGFTTAGAILVAQYTGADGDGSAGLVAGQTIFSVAVLSVLIGVGGFYTRPALEILPSDPDTAATVIPLAADYMEVIFAGIPLMFGFFVFSALMRGYGDTRTPMAVMVVSVFLNVLLDPFLIFGFSANPLFGWLAAVPLVAALDPVGLQEALFAATGFTGFELRVPQWRRYSLGGRHRDRPLAAVRHGARAGCLPEPSPPGSRVH